jgi:hypothetical protein
MPAPTYIAAFTIMALHINGAENHASQRNRRVDVMSYPSAPVVYMQEGTDDDPVVHG